MAGAFARLGSDPDLKEVFDSMHAFPALVSGAGGVEAAIAVGIDAVAKRGAEGNLGVAVRNGYGIAVKTWDGSNIVTGMAMVGTLDALDLVSPVAAQRLAGFRKPAVKGGGVPVGSFRVRLEFRWE
jgi:L-asparaginase II